MKIISSRKFVGTLLLATTAVMWGVSYLFTKVAVNDIPPMTLAFLRFVIAYLILIPATRKSRIKLKGKAHFYAAVSGFTGVMLYFFFENNGLRYTSASDASLIVSSAPILTMIVFDILKKRFDLLEYFGSILAFLGIFFIIYGGQFNEGSSVKGNFMAFGAAVSWAVYTYFFDKISNGSIRATTETILWGMLFIFPLSVFEILSGKYLISFSSSAISGILYLGIFASAIGYFMWGEGIRLWGGKAATLWVYTIPIFTVLSDILFFKNIPSGYFYGGAALVASGMIISVIRQFNHKSEPKTRPDTKIN